MKRSGFGKRVQQAKQAWDRSKDGPPVEYKENGWAVTVRVNQPFVLRPGDTITFSYNVHVPAETVHFMESHNAQPDWLDVLRETVAGGLVSAFRRRIPPGVKIHVDGTQATLVADDEGAIIYPLSVAEERS